MSDDAVTAKFIGELVLVQTRTNKKGINETTITFKVDNGRYGKVPVAIHDLQGLPCLVNLNENKPEDELDLDNE